jgi:rubrerythrin
MKLSLDQYLKLCSELEKSAARIYGRWSGSAEFDQRTRKLWLQMKAEEEDHFAQIELIRRQLGHGPECERALADNRIEEILASSRESLERVMARELNCQQALELALALEGSFKDFHTEMARHFDDPGLVRLFANLSSQDRILIDRLRALYGELFCSLPPSDRKVQTSR